MITLWDVLVSVHSSVVETVNVTNIIRSRQLVWCQVRVRQRRDHMGTSLEKRTQIILTALVGTNMHSIHVR